MGAHAPTSRPRPRWRSDIQGLRAVAVGMVVAFHAAPTWFPGGFAGVDVFFVISGFLITGGLARELAERGSISFGAFYARRIRRLVPAAALVLVVTLVAAQGLLPPLLLADLAGDARAAALYVANLRFADQATDYLTESDLSAVLHYWSLGVEEQFYLVWPLLLLAVARLARSRLAAALVVVGVASFAASVWWTAHDQPWAFFGLHTRAWEFALGGLVALGAARLRGIGGPVPAVATWLGLATLFAFVFAYDERHAFPGAIALIPVLGAVLVIAGGAVRPRFGAGVVLGLRPATAIGDVSYSLYLWHWPLLTLAAANVAPDAVAFRTRELLVLAAVALAFATTYLVENPVRRSAGLRAQAPRTFALGGTLTALVIGASIVFGGLPALDAGRPVAVAPGVNPAFAPAPGFVPSNLRPTLRELHDGVPFGPGHDGCIALEFSDTDPGECVYAHRRSRRTLALLGDSHMAQWFPAFKAIAERRGWRMLLLAKPSCPAASITVHLVAKQQMFRDCDRFREKALERLRRERPFAVVLASSRAYGIPGVPAPEFDRRYSEALVATIRALGAGTRAVLLADTPPARLNPPACLSRHLEDTAACAIPRESAVDPAFIRLERATAARAGAGFIDLTPEICPAGPCQPIRGDLLVFRDTNHLTTPFVEALRPVLERRLMRCLADDCG